MTAIGSKNTVSDATDTIIVGDNRTVTGANNTVTIGSSDAGTHNNCERSSSYWPQHRGNY